MNKICVVCGRPFEAKAAHGKYCSKVCANHSRFNRTHDQIVRDTEKQRQQVYDLYQQGLNDKEIGKTIGICITKVRQLRIELNLPKQMTKLQRQVFELREQGKCGYEIASELDIDRKQVSALARKVGRPYTQEDINRSISLAAVAQCKNDEEAFFAEYHPDWEYIDGRHSSDEKMTIRHRQCGNIVEKSAISIRKARTLKCPVCDEIARQERERIRAEEAERRRQEKTEQFWEQDFKQSSFTFKKCGECGLFFIGRSHYCSEECRRKHINRINDNRIKKEVMIDKDITLKKLFRRDRGVCWICGEQCDYDDCHKDEQGFFVVGKRYPSIDHVYPLSKGGVHSWDNVKLAHHYCNAIKNDKVV